MAIYLLFTAIIFIAIAKVLDNLSKKRLWLIGISSILTSSAIYGFILFAEKEIYRQINSKVVVDFALYPDSFKNPKNKILSIDNEGLVKINDLRICFTHYDLVNRQVSLFPKIDNIDGATSRGGIGCHNLDNFRSTVNSNYSYPTTTDSTIKLVHGHKNKTVSGWLLNKKLIKRNDSIRINLNEYLEMDQFLAPLKYDRIYAIRVTFRNALNSEKFVKYILTSSTVGGPEIIDNLSIAGTSGTSGTYPTDSSWTEFRDFIINNQMTLFGDSQSEIYLN